MQTFINYITGTTDYPFYMAQWFFAIVGLAISILLHARTRDKQSDNTPDQFSFRFLILDNYKRLFLSVLLIFIFIRFPDMLLTNFPALETLSEIRLGSALLIGLMLDKLAEWLKTKNWFGLADTKIRDQIKTDNNLNQ